MKHTPHELITGTNPSASITNPDDSIPAAQEHLKQLQEARSDAQKALQRCIKPLTLPRSFVTGDKVWLDACNLKIKAPSKKLSPRRYGPYLITRQVSSVTYQLQLPKLLRIHNVFHVDLLIQYHETKEHGANRAVLARLGPKALALAQPERASALDIIHLKKGTTLGRYYMGTRCI